jgi:hypothetical protein
VAVVPVHDADGSHPFEHGHPVRVDAAAEGRVLDDLHREDPVVGRRGLLGLEAVVGVPAGGVHGLRDFLTERLTGTEVASEA